MEQQILEWTVRSEPRLEHFVAQGNEETLQHLSTWAQGLGEPYLWLWGEPGSGKTHLLRATCRFRGLYVRPPLPTFPSATLPAAIAVDDAQDIAGDPAQELIFFQLYNRLRDAGKQLLVASRLPLGELAIQLPDLRSRLSWGPSLHLSPLGDAEKILLLITLCRERGMPLSEPCADFLLRRLPRDMNSLLHAVIVLDQQSLRAQHSLTIPFVNRLLLDGKFNPPETA